MTKSEREAAQHQWEGLVADFRASGLSGPRWCAQKGFKLRQLRYWVGKFRAADPHGSATTWVAVTPPVAIAPSGLTIRIGVAEMRVDPGCDPALLEAVIRALSPC